MELVSPHHLRAHCILGDRARQRKTRKNTSISGLKGYLWYTLVEMLVEEVAIFHWKNASDQARYPPYRQRSDV